MMTTTTDHRRTPYVGEGADGAARSAEIDRTEADTFDVTDPRYTERIASAARWDAQTLALRPRPRTDLRVNRRHDERTYAILPFSEGGLSCHGHDGPHQVGLNMKWGGWTEPMAYYVRQALDHVESADWMPPVPSEIYNQRRADTYEQFKIIAEQVCDLADRAPGELYVALTDGQWLALVECVLDAADYMITNSYGNDEDAEVAALANCFTDVHGNPSAAGLDLCWEGR